MLFKLVQEDSTGKSYTVDVSESIDKLNFSCLRGSASWRVHATWPDRGACIAHVIWQPAAAYRVYTENDDVVGFAQTIRALSIIVPVVKDRLKRLFWQGQIDYSRQCLPIVLVQPSE